MSGDAAARYLADVTGDPGQMWGESIVGFGTKHLRHAWGHNSTGRSCLYIKRLEDIDNEVLRELVVASMASSDDPGGPAHPG